MVIAEGGEARLLLLLLADGGEVVRKAYHRQAMGKALKELQALLVAGAHLPLPPAAAGQEEKEAGAASSSCPSLVRLQGVEWPMNASRPTALRLERARTDLRRFLQEERKRPLPLPQLGALALGLAAAVGRLHAAGLCHKDIHRCGRLKQSNVHACRGDAGVPNANRHHSLFFHTAPIETAATSCFVASMAPTRTKAWTSPWLTWGWSARGPPCAPPSTCGPLVRASPFKRGRGLCFA